jgi:PTH1 family peptidyl-tRNA hydrolase
MQLIVGLGNPGHEYDSTRHNVGFMAVDRIAEKHKATEFKQRDNCLIASLPQLKALLLKPITYMNLSGSAVLGVSSFYKIPPKDIIVIHDDIDLKLGDARTKVGGGNAGHNGLRSISAAVGNDYRRVRIGVGRPESKDYDIADWVLGKLAKSELTAIEKVISEKIPILYPECTQ